MTLTQKQIAAFFDMDQPTVSRIRNGQRGRIGAFNALKIAKKAKADFREVTFMPMPELWTLMVEAAEKNA